MIIPNKKITIFIFLFLLLGSVILFSFPAPSLTPYRAGKILNKEVFPHQDIVPFTLYGNNVLFIPHQGLEIDDQLLSHQERLAHDGFIKLSHVKTAQSQYMHDTQKSVVSIELTE